jgi:hypothetical protein
MKKFFEEAELEIVKFNNFDVITTSDINIGGDDEYESGGDVVEE